jgi:uncharacterized protein YjiS (DUF1127 family)
MVRWLIASRAGLLALRSMLRFAARLPSAIFAARRRRRPRATQLMLQSLDVHTLRDLGIEPGEIPFLAARLGEAGSLGMLARNAGAHNRRDRCR